MLSRVSFVRPDAPLRIRSPGDVIRMKALTSRWWSTPPLGFNAVIKAPIERFELTDSADGHLGQYTLPSQIFNTPIRKDIVHNQYWTERRALAGFQEQIQLHKWEWPGSNRKARPNLNTGLPKMGRRKAPGKWDGSFARPVRSIDLRRAISRRQTLKALTSVLTSKVAEKNFHIVETYQTLTHKTKNIRTHIRRIVGPRIARVLILHDKNDVNENFRWGCANVPGVRRELVDRVTPLMLLQYRKVVISKEALDKLIGMIENFPAKYGWVEKFATPTGKPAPVPASVPGWNEAWLEKRRKLQRSDFRLQEFWRDQKQWKWSTETRGPLKVTKFDDLAGFRLMNFAKTKEGGSGRWELQELYTDVEDIEP
jgi:large subunit ribosomal protein L4